METKPKTEEQFYTSKEFKSTMKEIVWESRIQTVALVLMFFFGVSTFMDIKKKLK